MVDPRTWSGRPLRGAAAVLIAFTLAVLGAAPASAATTTVDPFVAVDATTSGCDGIVVDAITPDIGVEYLRDGVPLTFPTGLLAFDRSGQVELTARALPGYVLGPNDVWLQRAPAACVTDLGPDSGPEVGNERKLSWCSSDPAPELRVYALPLVVPYTGLTRWRLVAPDGTVVASGEPGVERDYPVVAPVPTGLPLGRYDLELRNTASDQSLLPLSFPVYQYDCVTARLVRRAGPGKLVVFTNPSSLDARVLVRWAVPADGSYTEPDVIIALPARSSRRFRPHHRRIVWEAFPVEPGQQMGAGTITLPRPRRHP